MEEEEYHSKNKKNLGCWNCGGRRSGDFLDCGA